MQPAAMVSRLLARRTFAVGADAAQARRPLPLEGVTVVALEQAVAAPYCTCKMADAGARVIKLERKEGDFARGYDRFAGGATSSYFAWLNRGKQSLTIDAKDSEDQQLIHSILAKSSRPIFVQNLAPGAADRLGLGSSKLLELYPHLVAVDISGYGNNISLKAYDMLVQAESGLAHLSGAQDGAPTRVGTSVADISCGMYAYTAALEAAFSRERDPAGRGTIVQVSLFSSLADWMNVPYMHYQTDGKGPPCVGLRHPSVQPYAAYPTAMDSSAGTLGTPVLISIQNEREFANLCRDVLGDASVATDERFCTNVARCIPANSKALDKLIADAFTAMPREDLLERLKKAGIAYGEVNDVAGLAKHPALQTLQVEVCTGIKDKTVQVKCIAPPATFNGEHRTLGRIPALGEHDEAIRHEFG